jgi:hypothetical protein
LISICFSLFPIMGLSTIHNTDKSAVNIRCSLPSGKTICFLWFRGSQLDCIETFFRSFLWLKKQDLFDKSSTSYEPQSTYWCFDFKCIV